MWIRGKQIWNKVFVNKVDYSDKLSLCNRQVSHGFWSDLFIHASYIYMDMNIHRSSQLIASFLCCKTHLTVIIHKRGHLDFGKQISSRLQFLFLWPANRNHSNVSLHLYFPFSVFCCCLFLFCTPDPQSTIQYLVKIITVFYM